MAGPPSRKSVGSWPAWEHCFDPRDPSAPPTAIVVRLAAPTAGRDANHRLFPFEREPWHGVLGSKGEMGPRRPPSHLRAVIGLSSCPEQWGPGAASWRALRPDCRWRALWVRVRAQLPLTSGRGRDGGRSAPARRIPSPGGPRIRRGASPRGGRGRTFLPSWPCVAGVPFARPARLAESANDLYRNGSGALN